MNQNEGSTWDVKVVNFRADDDDDAEESSATGILDIRRVGKMESYALNSVK